MIKTLLLTNTIAPYRIPVLNKLDERLNIDLTVWYLQERENNREWKIEHKEINYKFMCLRGVHTYIQTLDMGVHFNPGLFYKLANLSPDVIITSGYDSPGYWSALLYSKIFRKKFIVWWGSTLESSRVKNKFIDGIRTFFFKQADSFITYGTESTNCLKYYGVDERKIVTGCNTVDIHSYFKQRKRHLASTNEAKKLNLLYIGQLIPRKGLEEVITALSEVSHKNWILRIVGSGPDEQYLKRMVEMNDLQDRILFEGYKQKNELMAYLNEADCLVFPSLREVWGLVVNEALATKTFVIASKYAGATKDIIIDKTNGIVIDPLDKYDLINSLEWVCTHTEEIKSNWSMPISLWKKLHPNYYARAVNKAIQQTFIN